MKKSIAKKTQKNTCICFARDFEAYTVVFTTQKKIAANICWLQRCLFATIFEWHIATDEATSMSNKNKYAYKYIRWLY